MSALAGITTLLILLCQDGAPTLRLLSVAPADVRPPHDRAERESWAVAKIQSRDGEDTIEAAVRALASELPETLGSLELLARSEDWRSRSAAMDIGMRGASFARDAGHRTRLRAIAAAGARDPVRAVRRNAARLFAEVGDTSAGELAALSRDAFFDVRMEAVRALVRGGSTDTVNHVAARLTDPDRSVAELAVTVLPRFGSGGASALAPFVVNRTSPLDLRLVALRSLRAEGTAGELGEAFLEIVKRPDEDRELRALALALALTVGSPFDPPGAVDLLLPVALRSTDLESQSAVIDGLIALGPFAADAVRKALRADSGIPQFTFNRLLAALPSMARKDAPSQLMTFFEELPEGRELERASIARMLGRHAPAGLSEFFRKHWNQCEPFVRREIIRAFRFREDLTAELCDLGLSDTTAETRRATFEIALENKEIPTARCIEAVRAEIEPTQYAEYLEMLSFARPDRVVRAFLLGILNEADSELFESVTSALDVFKDDAEVVQSLIRQHDRAYEKQLQQIWSDSDAAWRVRRMAIRAIGRVGGRAAEDFLRLRARSERAVDEDLGSEAIVRLATLSPDDAVFGEIIDSVSLPKVRIEAAIALASRGKAQGVRALARDVGLLTSDSRTRALESLRTGHGGELRETFLRVLALDQRARFNDESRFDAIRDLAFVDSTKAFETLSTIVQSDRSTDARLEAIAALGARRGDEGSAVLVGIGSEIVVRSDRNESDDVILRSIARALGHTRSSLGVDWLIDHLFERVLKEAPQYLLHPSSSRTAFERKRAFDREYDAARALASLGARVGKSVGETLQERVRALRAGGQLLLVDPTVLLDLVEIWGDVFPSVAEELLEFAGICAADLDPRFRALFGRAQMTGDRRAAAIYYDAAQALAASGAVESALVQALGTAEAQWGRRPRIWLRCAALIARADAAFAEKRQDNAVRFLEEALRRGARDTRTLFDVAASFHAHGLPKRSRDTLVDALTLAPGDASLHEALAWLFVELDDPARALERFRLAVTLDTDGVFSRSAQLGIVASQAALHRDDMAVDALVRLISGDPGAADDARRNPYVRRIYEMLHVKQAGGAPAESAPSSRPK